MTDATAPDAIKGMAAAAEIHGSRFLVWEGNVRRMVRRRPDGGLEHQLRDGLGGGWNIPLPAPLAAWMEQDGAALTWRLLPEGDQEGKQWRLCLVAEDGTLLWREAARDLPVSLASAAPHAHGGPSLGRGARLRHQSLTSVSGSHTLVHQEDGNLVLYCNSGSGAAWATDTWWAGDGWAELADDGDLVVRNVCGAPVWRSGTAGSAAHRLEVGDDGRVALRAADGSTVWEVRTHAPCGRPGMDVGRGHVLRRGQVLQRQSLTSADGGTVLAHTDDRLVLFGDDGSWLWNAHVQGGQSSRLLLDHDGMLRVLSGAGMIARELGGPADELAVLPGEAQLRRGAAVIWRNGRRPGADDPPSAEDYESWIDALVDDSAYCVTVIRDLGPDEALSRMGARPGQISAGTWRELLDRAAADDADLLHKTAGGELVTNVVVAAFKLGPHVLLVEDNGFHGVDSPQLSAGTFAVSCYRSVNGDSAFVVFRDGAKVADHSYENGSPEPSTPEVRAALAVMGVSDDDALDAAFERDLELLCRTAGVHPTVAGVTAEARIAIIPMEWPPPRPHPEPRSM